MLRLDMNLVWNIVNLIVLYLLLKHFLIGPVTDIMNKRQAMIKESIESARVQEDRAGELKRQYEEKLASSEEEGLKLLEESRNKAKVQYDRIMKEAREKADELLESSRRKAMADQEKAMEEARGQIAGLVVAAAAKIMNREAGADDALYDSFLAEAGDFHDTGSN